MSLPGTKGADGGIDAVTGFPPVLSRDVDSEWIGHGAAKRDEVESLSAVARDVGQLIVLYRDNERLLEKQRQLKGQIAEAMAYWRRDDSRRELAWARLAQLRVRHQAVLTHLRANRAMALELMDRTEVARDDRVAS